MQLLDIDDIYLKKPKTKIDIQTSTFGSIEYTCASMQGWRKSMEDAIITENFGNVTLFGVLDGHGGQEVAEIVSRQFPLFLKSNKYFLKQDYHQALVDTFSELGQWIQSPDGLYLIVQIHFKGQFDVKLAEKNAVQALGKEIIDQCGCTANIVLIDEEKVYCANLGDSRSVGMINKKPQVMSFDHKPEDRAERMRIIQAGGFVEEGRVCGSLSLSRAFGDLQFHGMVSFEPDIRIWNLKDVEFILMGCDGIWECQKQDYGESLVKSISRKLKSQSTDVIVKGILLSSLAPAIKETTVYGLDNMSCILIRTKSSFPETKKKINKKINV